MWAASLEWPLALRMARRVSMRADLTAEIDDSPSPRRRSRRLESADLDPRRTAGLDPLGTDPSTPETMKLPVAVERSESPWRLVTERSSAELGGPSWMAGKQTGGPSRGPRAPTWRPWTQPWGPDIPSAVLEGPWSWMAVKQTGGPSRGPRAPTWRPWTRPLGPDISFCSTWETILNSGKANRRPLPWSQGTDMASMNSALGSGYGDATGWVVCWRKSQTSQPVVRPTGQTQVVDTPWPSCLADSGQEICLDVVDSWQMDGNQRYRLVIAPLEQAYRHLHECVRSCASLVLDVSHSLHCSTSREPPGDLRWGRKSLTIDDGLHLQNLDVPESLRCWPLSLCRAWA